MARGVRGLARLWRQLLRLERPGKALVRWSTRGVLGVLLACLLAALLSSWPWLVEPSLLPGSSAPFTARAPRDATVVDSAALEQRRMQMVPQTEVQVVDANATQSLQAELDRRLQQVRQQASTSRHKVDPLNLSEEERRWLQGLAPPQLLGWERAVRQAQLRMLTQGVVATIADDPLLLAASLQLEDQPAPGRSLGSRLVAGSLQGRTNLRSDTFLSQRRLEELVSRQGLPTIRVKRGDLITRQGERISSQS
ncbi:MAG TPA: HD family phosphohydrolase, partial [Cyanobium sp.]|nr:HD family phosphohydrolase [Cyanobium sp.]